VREAAADVQVGEAAREGGGQSATPASDHPPLRSRASSTTAPPESRTLNTSLSVRRPSSHHSPTSRQRSRTRATRRFLQEHHPRTRKGRKTSTRPHELSRTSTGSPGARADSPPRRQTSSDARLSQGERSKCSATALLEPAVGNNGSSKPGGLQG
jgi:hypothetical protein